MQDDPSGWNTSAQAWIDAVAEDVNRIHVMDPVMLSYCEDIRGKDVVDIGCGEGRFCRLLGERGAKTTGIDPTVHLIERARELDPAGNYVVGSGEDLPFEDAQFDVAVSYVVLLDVTDFRAAIREMARVLKPGGMALYAGLNPFATTMIQPWIKDEQGNRLHFAMDNYNEERADRVEWKGISIVNYHRPLHMYLNAFIEAGFRMTAYHEPIPTPEAIALVPTMADYLRVPYMNVIAWRKD